MTIAQVMERLNEVKPHQYSEAAIAGWLSDLDGRIYENYHRGHEELMEGGRPGPYDAADADRELLVGPPYEDLYIRYVSAQVDYYNAEFARYNNSMVMFNLLLGEYVNYITRNHKRPQPRIKLF